MSHTELAIAVPDGKARSHVFKPNEGKGPWPAVLFFMDGPGIRPALFEMAERLASNGYYVLLPDMFWRLPPYEPTDVKAVMPDPVKRGELFGRLMGSTNPEKSTSDTGAFLDFLAKQPEVKPGKVGAIGYCMGGGMAIRAAGNFPGRVGAVGAFHAGNVGTEAPDSPHQVAHKIKAKVLVAGADNDSSFDAAQKERLEKALKAGDVDAEVTIYEGALHGYAPPDFPVYNREASERHWREMLALFKETIG